MIRPISILAFCTAIAVVDSAAAAQVAPRSVVPIREVVIPQTGEPRFVIDVVVNGVSMQAGFDTGSTGLRLLPRAAARARVDPRGAPETYIYGSGVRLDGHRADVNVRIGSAVGSAAIQAVDRIGCVQRQADCPASQLPPQQYGLMGSGFPGQGFPAIIGTRLSTDRINNPLPAMGVRRWIVHLPQPGRGGGVLILNPGPRDLAGFVPVRPGAGAPNGMVAACVTLPQTPMGAICGPTLLDTGAPGLRVLNAEVPPRWAQGRRARLTMFASRSGRPVPLGFITGDKRHGAATSSKTTGGAVTIHAGTLPFYAYDVLFDANANTIAVRPNSEAGPNVVPLTD